MKYRDRSPEQKEKIKSRVKERKAERRAEHNAYKKKYQACDINTNGKTKCNIRAQSHYILYKTHSKLKDYEIHHCFGYDDPNKFIYIPRSLHLEIHQLLRDNNIPADSNHWNAIRDLVNSCEQYTYIRT